tara:strand:- start:38974 stop:42948 length:3975 start_codon:yes stop_codon:yes gene_type:complete
MHEMKLHKKTLDIPDTKCIFSALELLMKNIFLFLGLLVCSLPAFSQTRSNTISWETEANSSSFASSLSALDRTASAKKTTREKASERLKLSLSKDVISYTDQWEDTAFANPKSLKVTNVRYAGISSEALKAVTISEIPNSLQSQIISKKGRNQIYTILSLSPLVRVNGQIKKIVSFSVSYTYHQNNKGAAGQIPIMNSVLATGDWFKFKIEKTGVHVITKAFLENIGMNTSGIDPATIKVYGHGGKPLPLLNSKNNNLFDLPENSIQIIGQEDGSFDAVDQILFYAISTIGYDQENDTHINPYSDEAFYYITHGGAPGLRVQQLNEPSGDGDPITSFNDYQFHEIDDFSPAKVGRRWFGNRFDIEDNQTYEFVFPNIVQGSAVEVNVNVASASESSTSMAVSLNGTAIDPINFSVISGSTLLSYRPSSQNADPYVIPASGETVTVNLLYNNGSNPSSIGYLDYIRVGAQRQLIGGGEQFSFRYALAASSFGLGTYSIANASQISQLWDVTHTNAIGVKNNEAAANTFSFNAALGDLREYVAVTPTDYFLPISIANANVLNQNIKGTIFQADDGSFQDVDYLIVTAPFLLQQALRLAAYHKAQRGLNVKVVTVDKIYEEFSSGKQDIGAIRNLVRYIYENASSPEKKIKYVGILGDTSIDYKNRLPDNNMVVPTFNTLFSSSTWTSYMSDDFFGMMDADPSNGNDEGIMGSDEKVDVAFGRILADNAVLADAMIDKVVSYEKQEAYGNWRNNIVMVSDDVDIEWEFNKLQGTLDALSDRISLEKPFVNVKKIHMDAFEQETSAGGNRYPEVNQALKNDIEVGALIINYFGHGGEDGLAKEFIYTKETATSLRNPNTLPMIVTVTCEFTKFDLPTRITAGELTFWNKEGGAISLITTTRSIGVQVGSDLNELLADEIFGIGQDVPDLPAIGLRKSKNQVSSVNRRVVFYIGDPALPLAFPKKDIRLTTINGAPISSSSDVLQGLGYVQLGGQVLNADGSLASTYNGVLEAKVFDKRIARQTLGNDGTQIGGELGILNFTTLGETIFSGQASVTNGQFEFDFIVPRDVQIPLGNGKVSFYSKQNGLLRDNNGFNLDIQVGGLNANAGTDNTGPIIELFMNDESFVPGGVTNDSPNLIVKLEDSNGINTASGIGHDLIAILDGDEANPFKLNDYYQADVDDYSKGTAAYKLRDLEDGLHTLSVKAWDTYNNSSTQEIDFRVAGDDTLEITRVLNYPNPFVDYTEFWFNHNRPYEPLDVQVQVFTVTGKVVWTQNQLVNTEGFLSRSITWNGLDDFGQKLAKGVYVYKITVKSTLTNQQTEKFEKLVIL